MKKLLEANTGSGRRRVAEVFRDYCELTALSFRNAVDRAEWDRNEARYLEVAGRYTRDELNRFAELTAHLAIELDHGFDDVLGGLYMSLDLGNDRLGQFFTPYEVSVLSAKLTAQAVIDELEDRPFISMHEPSCGSGGMIIALAQVLKDAGVNPQHQLHVTAVDLDATAVHMTYVHLALLNIPALVVHGNTLTLDTVDVWPTPGHILRGWSSTLRSAHTPFTTTSKAG